MGARVPVLQLARIEIIRELALFEQKQGRGGYSALPTVTPMSWCRVELSHSKLRVNLGLLDNQVVLTVIKGAEPWGAAEPKRSRLKLLAI